MLSVLTLLLLLFAVILKTTQTISVPVDIDHLPPGLGRAGRTLAARLQDRQDRSEPRLPLPAADLDAIKKVAQVLIALGQQVIPAIIGDSPHNGGSTTLATEIPNDPVKLN